MKAALRILAALCALSFAANSLPEIEQDEHWQFADQLYREPFSNKLFGAPCTLKTDIEEHTCHLKIRTPR